LLNKDNKMIKEKSYEQIIVIYNIYKNDEINNILIKPFIFEYKLNHEYNIKKYILQTLSTIYDNFIENNINNFDINAEQ